ncbi:hypothetical protein [Paenibacillus sp. FSL M7-1046]|uniref:hypothetical protein n=1 Tax=Paenibacillus sp. FSL M7-1046 TaxID=2975315 RepID=UPI0030F5FD7A
MKSFLVLRGGYAFTESERDQLSVEILLVVRYFAASVHAYVVTTTSISGLGVAAIVNSFVPVR